MMQPTFFCDECHAQRKEANHWFIASRRGDGFLMDQNVGDSILIFRFTDEIAKREGIIHLCGAVCVHKFVDKFLGTKVSK